MRNQENFPRFKDPAEMEIGNRYDTSRHFVGKMLFSKPKLHIIIIIIIIILGSLV